MTSRIDLDDDQLLVTRLIERDEIALSQLYDQTISKVYALAIKITRDSEIAEEVTEDTYFQIWQEISRFDFNKCPLTSWILIICRSRAIDALRKRKSIQEIAVDYDLHEDLLRNSPQDNLEQKQRQKLLQDAFSLMTSLQKQALYHAFYFGLSHQEISNVMQVPLGSVKSAINRAQKLLKENLKGDMFEK